jgi:hypothetical protein
MTASQYVQVQLHINHHHTSEAGCSTAESAEVVRMSAICHEKWYIHPDIIPKIYQDLILKITTYSFHLAVSAHIICGS